MCDGTLLGLKLAGASALSWPVVATVIVVVALFTWRVSALGVDADDDQLIVRNFLRTTTIDRREIEGVRVGRAPTQPFGGSGVIVATSGGRLVHVTITARAIPLAGSRRLDDELAVLRKWLARH